MEAWGKAVAEWHDGATIEEHVREASSPSRSRGTIVAEAEEEQLLPSPKQAYKGKNFVLEAAHSKLLGYLARSRLW